MDSEYTDYHQEKVKELLDLLVKADIVGLKALGEQCSEQALLREDKELVSITVIAYSIGKFMEKPYILDTNEWEEFKRRVGSDLTRCELVLENGKIPEYVAILSTIINNIERLSESAGRFMRNVVEKARIKAAAQMYAHGASLGAACALSAADKKEVSSYIGATKLPDRYSTIPLKERLLFANSLFYT